MKKAVHHMHTLAFQLALGFFLLAFLITVLLSLLGYFEYKSTVLQIYGDRTQSAAQIAAGLVDGDRVGRYLESGETDGAYWEMAAKMDKLRIDADLQYLYVYVPEGEYLVYLYEAANDFTEARKLGERDIFDAEGSQEIDELMKTGVMPEIDYEPGYDEHFGYTMLAIMPVYDSENKVAALVTAEMPAARIDGQLQKYLLIAVGIGAAVTLVMVLFFMSYLRKRVTYPLRRLSEAASAFADSRKGFDGSLVQLRCGAEVESLAQSLNKMAVDINRYIADLTVVTAEKERVATELAVAAKIQSSMLPCIFPAFPDRKEFDIYGYMRPAKAVGGDFYDFFFVDRDHLCLVIADVSGKGVPAALFMVIAKTLIKNYAQAGFSPAQVFERVNAKLCENNDAGMFVTAFLGIVDLRDGSFTYANAGHNPPLLAAEGKNYQWLESKHCFVLAGRKNMPYREQTVTLHKGDLLFLYTDGVTEAMNTRHELYTDKRLLSLLQGFNGLSLREIVQRTDDALTDFAGGGEQADDITMLVFKTL